jgi:hypothetical protein
MKPNSQSNIILNVKLRKKSIKKKKTESTELTC